MKLATHTIGKISFEGNEFAILIDGKQYKTSLERISSRLFAADLKQREMFKISQSGYGIHWPLIDEDLSIDGIISSCHG